MILLLIILSFFHDIPTASPSPNSYNIFSLLFSSFPSSKINNSVGTGWNLARTKLTEVKSDYPAPPDAPPAPAPPPAEAPPPTPAALPIVVLAADTMEDTASANPAGEPCPIAPAYQTK
jgi:hypothetical protein